MGSKGGDGGKEITDGLKAAGCAMRKEMKCGGSV
jgi:hypothetical protein